MHKESLPASTICISASATDSLVQIQRWEKVLWKEQNFPDNYTDSSFLLSLEVNAQVPDQDYWKLVNGASAVTQQISTVALVTSVSVYLYEGTLQPTALLSILFGVTALCGLACMLAESCSVKKAKKLLRQFCLLATGVYLMSPLQQTLTRSVSSDSTVALACGLLVAHLYLHDYPFVDRMTDTLTGSVSLTAATFASVLVASRLKTQIEVFSQVLFSLELYLWSPYARAYVKNKSPVADQGLTLTMHVVAVLVLWPISALVACMYLVAVVFITFLCPMWLVKVHKYKAKINGAWDEAVPNSDRPSARLHLSVVRSHARAFVSDLHVSHNLRC